MAGTVRENALIGQVVANYRIGPLIGRGGMGAVYEVTHQFLGRRAALKVLHSQFAQTPDLAARFVNEARAANLVQHPSVVSVFEIGLLPDGTPYILMEYLHGQTLSQRIRELAATSAAAAGRGRAGPATASARVLLSLQLARQLASALHALHERGVIHRDLKPDNVVLVKDPEAPGGERAKLLDFGIAKIVGDCGQAEGSPFPGVPAQAKTALGALLGTPIYMGPEQWRGKGNVDHRADIYALGCILYELLSGRPPYCASAIVQLMQMHVWQKPPSALFAQTEVPRQLAELVQRMLAKDPADRPSTAQLDRELEQILAAVRPPPAAALGVHQAATLAMWPRVEPPGDETIPILRQAPTQRSGRTSVQRPAVAPRGGFPPSTATPGSAGPAVGAAPSPSPVASMGDAVPLPPMERTASGSAQLFPVPRVRWGVRSALVAAGIGVLVSSAFGVKHWGKQPADKPPATSATFSAQGPGHKVAVPVPTPDPDLTLKPSLLPPLPPLPLPAGSWVIRSNMPEVEVREAKTGRVLGLTPLVCPEAPYAVTEIVLVKRGYGDRHITLDVNNFGEVLVKLRKSRRRPG